MKHVTGVLSVFCISLLFSAFTMGVAMAEEANKLSAPPGWVVIEKDIYYVFDKERVIKQTTGQPLHMTTRGTGLLPVAPCGKGANR